MVQVFLTIAETGSLSAAARKLGRSQPTVGRQIKVLEQQLGAELFQREPRGLALTPTGASLVDSARQMADAMQHIAMTAAGQQTALKGTVRIATSSVFAYAHMPAIIAKMRKAEPQIEIELVPSDDTSNLLYREADIAVRMYRPTQLDLITSHIGDMHIGAYATHGYLRERGMPRSDNLGDHDFVGYDQSTTIIDGFAQAGIVTDKHSFGVRCDDYLIYWRLVRAGCGIGFSQTSIGDADPEMKQIDFGFPIPPLPIWLTAHETMRQTPRVRRIWDMLKDALTPLVS